MARAYYPVTELSLEAGAYTCDGSLVLPCVSAYSAAVSGSLLDMAGSSVDIRVDQVPVVGNGSTEAQFGIRYNSSNYCLFLYGGTNSLAARVVTGGVQTDHYGIVSSYSAETHKYWRLREASGTIYFETSASRGTWTTAWSGAHGWSAALVAIMRVRFACGYWGSETSPGRMIIGAVNSA